MRAREGGKQRWDQDQPTAADDGVDKSGKQRSEGDHEQFHACIVAAQLAAAGTRCKPGALGADSAAPQTAQT
ncbi:MAG: hypothetical protein Fur007_06240 [Rhodoferax sp.]